MGMPAAYSLVGYGKMITDRPRMEPYVQALRRAVRPGSIVLDIGAGAGIFSLLACQFGAGHVYSVEPDDSIQVAYDLAKANGFADRITFHQTLSSAVTLPQPADVIVSDLRGILPLFQHHIPAVIDVRKRLLAPGGILIPQRDTLWAALVEDAGLYKQYCEPWLGNDYGLDLSAGHPLVVNNWRNANIKSEQVLVRPQQWATLDYTTVENANISGELVWEAERPGIVHGLLIWFDAELADDIGFSNAPGKPELVYGQAFFPLQEAITLEQGDQIEVQILANLVADDYVWNWNTKVYPRDNTAEARTVFSQSTFYGKPLNMSRLKRHEAGYVPHLTQDAEIDRLCLSLINGSAQMGDIARQVASSYPARFRRWEDALSHVADLWERYVGTDP